ncbi:MAG: hypothetical protein RLY89_787 [Bacteroidota bacterium]|jgi:hypothetical protein
MPLNKIFSCLLAFVLTSNAIAQTATVQILQSGTRKSFRGLSVVNDQVLWVSGSAGTVGRSTDGGVHVDWITVPGFEKKDFRDIAAFDDQTAIIMGIAEPAVIVKTTDAGKTWRTVFTDSTKGMFLDAMDFYDSKNGAVIGDPINGKFFLAITKDQGETWSTNDPLISKHDLTATDGEAFFASSGTNLVHRGKEIVFATGGKKSRLFYENKIWDLPLLVDKESTGANSLVMDAKGNGIIVGGDFSRDTIKTGNAVLFEKGGNNMRVPRINPQGYKSCVIYLTNTTLVACGTSGVDLSYDRGLSWVNISKESFHVVQKAAKGNAVFLAGGNGKLAKLVFN